MLKAMVHVNFADAERQKHGLKNITNVLRAEGGKTDVVVVCHGSGIALVVEDRSPDAEAVRRLLKEGVRFVACENTMREKSIGRDDLITGVGIVPSGAVEVVRKQQEGFGYFRP